MLLPPTLRRSHKFVDGEVDGHFMSQTSKILAVSTCYTLALTTAWQLACLCYFVKVHDIQHYLCYYKSFCVYWKHNKPKTLQNVTFCNITKFHKGLSCKNVYLNKLLYIPCSCKNTFYVSFTTFYEHCLIKYVTKLTLPVT